jgi:nucleotide-binding universal stress UspA family protein
MSANVRRTADDFRRLRVLSAVARVLPSGTLFPSPAVSRGMKVLLGMGGSEDSFRALDQTIERTLEAGDDLTVAVVDNPDSEPAVEDVAARARDALASAGLSEDVRVVEGHPGSGLVELAESEGYDCIVLGGGETSPLGKVKLGSIAEFVLLNAKISVTLVR